MLNAILWENGGTWSVIRNTQSGIEIHSGAICLHMVRCKSEVILALCVYTWLDISAEPFWRGVFTHGQI